MRDATIQYIVARIIQNAIDAKADYDSDTDDLYEAGRRAAYYEVLDTLQTELEANGEDLKDFNLDVSLEKEFL